MLANYFFDFAKFEFLNRIIQLVHSRPYRISLHVPVLATWFLTTLLNSMVIRSLVITP